jgi:glycosyltransferase involved in cell wall biosynthesis
MDLQVLVATMHQKDYSLLEKMNIDSDAIIANQCDKNEIESFDYKGHHIRSFSFAERGVGLNRNNALMRATNDICLLADDDIVLKNNYGDIIFDSFKQHPNADVIIFNLDEEVPKRFIIKEKMKIGYLNYMRFGAARIAFRTRSITKNGISFNLHFGGGAQYSAGEDTLFLRDCLKNKLKIIALPITIGKIEEDRPSTWFNGFNDKYFIDRGALFAAISRKWARILCLQFLIRHRKMFKTDMDVRKAYRFMVKGLDEFLKKDL